MMRVVRLKIATAVIRVAIVDQVVKTITIEVTQKTKVLMSIKGKISGIADSQSLMINRSKRNENMNTKLMALKRTTLAAALTVISTERMMIKTERGNAAKMLKKTVCLL